MLNNHPAIEKSVVVPIDDELVNQVPVAFIVLSPKQNLTEMLLNDIKYYVPENLEPVYCPVTYHFVNKFPLTKVGKVDYRALEQKAERLAWKSTKMKKR